MESELLTKIPLTRCSSTMSIIPSFLRLISRSMREISETIKVTEQKHNKIHYIDIGEDFAKRLGGRLKKDSKNSGEEFFEKLLEPAFLANDKVIILLDSLTGWSAGFMEEAFGGLVRKYGYREVIKKITFETKKRQYLVRFIERWMHEAET